MHTTRYERRKAPPQCFTEHEQKEISERFKRQAYMINSIRILQGDLYLHLVGEIKSELDIINAEELVSQVAELHELLSRLIKNRSLQMSKKQS